MRLAALPLPGMVDVKAWKAWGAYAADVGVARVYGPSDADLLKLAGERGGPLHVFSMPFPRAFHWYRGEEFYVDYPPGSMLLLWAAGKLYAVLDPGGERGRLYNVLINLLHLAGSLAIALVLRRSAPGRSGSWRALAFWCNPATVLGSVLGYQDTIVGAAALLAVLALARGEHVLAAALAAGAALLKPQGTLLLPALIALLLLEAPVRTWVRAALAGAAVATLVLAPWWAQGYLLSAVNGGLRPLTEGTLSGAALNVWWIAGYALAWARDGAWPLARILFLDEFQATAGWDARAVSRLLLLAGTVGNLVLLLRRPPGDRLRVPLAVILQTHLWALFGTSVHENHTYLAVVLSPLLLGAWDRGRAVVALTSGFLAANLFLMEGLGRGLIADRRLYRLRLLTGVDMTVLVAAAHVALVVALVVWAARRDSARRP